MVREAQSRVQIERAGADFHAAGTGLVAARYQQRLAGVAQVRVRQRPRRRDIQAVARTQVPGQVIVGDQAAAVEIQPQFARQPQPVTGIGLPARAFLHLERGALAHRERRQAAPFVRHIGLRGIDRLRARDARVAQRRRIGVAPDFLWRPRRRRCVKRQLRERCGAARRQCHRPVARPQLHAQAAIGIKPRGQVAVERGGHETIRQHRPQQLFACAAGNMQPDHRIEGRRSAIGEPAERAQAQRIRFALPGRARTQRDPVAVAFGPRHRDTVHLEVDQRDRGRQAQARGAFVPAQVALHCVVAHGQSQRRHAVAIKQHRGRVVHPHLLRPRLAIARQGCPAFRVDMQLKLEMRAGLVGIQRQAAGPDAFPVVAATRRGKHGTGLAFVAMQHPRLPVL